MGTAEDTARVKKNIVSEFEIKKAKYYALSLFYAGKAINRFRSFQPDRQGGKDAEGHDAIGKDARGYWTNRTVQARNRMFSNAFIEAETVGWFLSHGVEYGIYLELANNRQNEAIRPIVRDLSVLFYEDVRKI